METNRRPSRRLKFSFLTILTGSDLTRRRLPVMEARSPKAGPTVWLTGCAHGDEVGGVVVIQELFHRLRQHPLRSGSVHAFPLMNPSGFELATRHIGWSEEDLNRAFPGDAKGSPAERIAQRIFETMTATRPNLVLDLHNDWVRSIPYALIDPPSAMPGVDRKALLEWAAFSGLPIISESEADHRKHAMSQTLSAALGREGIPALTLELGGAYIVSEKYVAYGVAAVWALLTGMGMVEPLEEAPGDPGMKEWAGRVLHYTDRPAASTSGVVRFRVNAGQRVRAGQPVAQISNVFGKRQETLRAPGDALVLGHADSAVAFPGSPLVAYGLLNPP